MTKNYFLQATGVEVSENVELVDFVAQRLQTKNNMWRYRNDALVSMGLKFDNLISIYDETGGNQLTSVPRAKSKGLIYRSAMAHQTWNNLMGTKLEPDFIDYRPLVASFQEDLTQASKNITQAHKIIRYKGHYDKAKEEAKKDLIWGNSFVEMSIRYENDKACCVDYNHVPFKEFRNYYGDTDRIRISNYPFDKYASIYGEDQLGKVAEGGIFDTQSEEFSKNHADEQYILEKNVIQVIKYYDGSRKIFAEIHGGNGFIFQNLEGEDYPFTYSSGEGYDPFKESRFYEPGTSDYFGWGVMDYILDLANLETSITNATAMDALWDSSAPSFITSNDPDDMEKKIDKWQRERGKGINRPIIQKNTGLGTGGQIQSLKRNADNGNMDVWNNLSVTKATQFSGMDMQSLSDFAPTAEQQKLRKIEADKLNIRVLLLNENREREFAIKEMAMMNNERIKFNSHEIEVIDAAAEQFATDDGFMPGKMMKIKDILDDVKNVELKISPRMEGVLADQDFIEIQSQQQDFAFLAPGSAASDIALEKYFAKKNPDLGLKRTDFAAPTPPEQQQAPQGPEAPQPSAPGENAAEAKSPTAAAIV